MAVSDLSSKLRIPLNNSTKDVSKSFERLSSGKRINRASDDAAGLAIVSSLEADVKTSLQGARNAVDGVSIASIAESALGQVSDITSRQQELATQAANGTLSDEQRTSLNDEFQQLEQEKQRIFGTTQFNGVSVFNNQGTQLQVGSGSDSNSQISLTSINTSSLGANGADISNQAAAQAALDSLKNTSQNVSQVQGQIGAAVSRLDVAEQNARNNALESESAASRIRDADVADETAKLTAANIRQQQSAALAAQSGKLQADSVLQLLK